MTPTARTRPPVATPSRRPSGVVRATLSTYGRMKSLQRISDAGSIPATSTTTGVLGFDGMNSCDGRPAMVPAASGSAWSGVRCDGPKSQTPMTSFIGLRRQPDVPAARNGTQGRHLFNGPNVKHGTDARAKRASIGTTACASGFGVAFMCVCWAGLGACSGIFSRSSSHGVCAERTTAHDVAPVVTRGTLSIASSNTSNVGFKRLLRASFYAATQTIGVNRAPSLEMVIGVAAPFNAAFLAEPNPHLRKHANKHGQQTGAANMRASREKFARVAGNAQAIPASNAAPIHPARRAPGFRPTDAGGSFFAMRELMTGAL